VSRLDRTQFSAISLEELRNELMLFVEELRTALRYLDPVENFRGTLETATFSVTPGTELTIAHNLGFVPTGYIMVKINNTGGSYPRIMAGPTAWTTSNLYLVCDVASVGITTFIF